MPLSRRVFLSGAAVIAGAAGAVTLRNRASARQDDGREATTGERENSVRDNVNALPDFDQWQLTEAEWKERLAPEAYAVLRREATERPWSSPLNEEKRAGIFACAGCGLDLFRSKAKFESGTGWPSFYDAVADSLGTTSDYKLIIPRTEYHCARCGGHQGHVFKDGPEPTGLRYCNNGVALTFRPDTAA